MKKLNVGCGLDIRKGWSNLDNHKTNGANVVFDLNNIFNGKKMPFRDNTFDYILVSAVLHTFIDPIPILNELVRVCKKGGEIEVKTPLNNSNFSIYGKRGYTQGMLRGYASGMNDYNPQQHKGNLLKVIRAKYYTNSKRGLIKFITSLLNKLSYSIVERTVLINLIHLNVNIIYKKLN